MTVEQNKALKHRICDEIWNKGNLDLIPELVGSSWSSGRFKGPDGFREMVSNLRTALPDLRITIDNLVGEGDLVSYHSTLQGTFKGKFGDNEPTGRTVNFKTAYCDRFAYGKWVETVWGVSPTAELFQQMGINTPTSKEANTAIVRAGLLPLRPHHVGILVRDLEASIAWYHDILGFTVVARDWLDWLIPPFRHRIALLTNGVFYIELFGFKNEQTMSAGQQNIAPGVDDTPGMKTLAFYAPNDWEKFTEMLERKHVLITERGQKGNARIIRDNSGNALEFLTQEGLDKTIQRGAEGRGASPKAKSRDRL